MSAPRRRWPISVRSMPTASILPTIPFPISRPSPSRAALAEAEIRLTRRSSPTRITRRLGRVHWTRVSADISYDRKAPEPGDVLAAMPSAKDVSEALAAYEPHDPGLSGAEGQTRGTPGRQGRSGRRRDRRWTGSQGRHAGTACRRYATGSASPAGERHDLRQGPLRGSQEIPEGA